MAVERKGTLKLGLCFLVLIIFCVGAESQCSDDCDALASYYVWSGLNLTFISRVLSSSFSEITSYNPQITNIDVIEAGSRVNVPFSCGCINGEFMGHMFVYHVNSGDYYQLIAQTYYSNLTTIEMLQNFNTYQATMIPYNGRVNVTVNCSCGNIAVSKDYGLFITYPLRPGEKLSTIAGQSGVSEQLLEDYNPNSNFSSGSGLVFIPGRDQNQTFPPLKSSSKGISGGVIAGISVAGVAGAMLLAGCFCFGFYRRKKVAKESFLLVGNDMITEQSLKYDLRTIEAATKNFCNDNKIGEGGFGAVYKGTLPNGQEMAVKRLSKSSKQGEKEFKNEVVLVAKLQHRNLVRLLGFCLERQEKILIYEFVPNKSLDYFLFGLTLLNT